MFNSYVFEKGVALLFLSGGECGDIDILVRYCFMALPAFRTEVIVMAEVLV